MENMFSQEILSLLDLPSPSPLHQLDGNMEDVTADEEYQLEVKREVKLETEELTEKSELKGEDETGCLEAFQDPKVGGLALALPHGSLLVEVVKQELHTTTVMRSPNKMNPCWVGLVFYQQEIRICLSRR